MLERSLTVDRLSRIPFSNRNGRHSRMPAVDESIDNQASMFRVALRKAEIPRQ